MDIVLRVAFVYVFILVTVRVMGKRELSHLSPLELVTLILIPEIVSDALRQGDESMTAAVIGVSTLLVLVFLTSVLTYKSRRLASIVEGDPGLLVEAGEPVQETMDTERVTEDEILSEVRRAGIERIEDVKWAVLEAGGQISVIGFDPAQKPPPSEDTLPA